MSRLRGQMRKNYIPNFQRFSEILKTDKDF